MASTPPPPPGGTPPPPPSGGQPPGYPPTGYVPYGGPGPDRPAMRTNGLAVASLVLGIIGIITCFFFIPWILAIIFGIIAIKQCNDDPTYTGKGLAVAGLVCGIVAGALILLILVAGDATFYVN